MERSKTPEVGFQMQSAPRSLFNDLERNATAEEQQSQHNSTGSIKQQQQQLPRKLFAAFAPQDWVILLQKFGAEVVSTFVLVFAGCGAVVVDATSHGQITHVGVAITFGLTVTVMIYTVGHISGCHMNPAVSIALASIRQMEWGLVPMYAAAQVLGATVAAFLLRLIFASHHAYDDMSSYNYLGSTFPSNSSGAPQALVIELFATFILMFVITGVATDPNAVPGFGGLAIGATIGLLAMVTGPVTGGSFNPARTLGPALAANMYKDLWVYFLGPILGALAGAWAYVLIRMPPPAPAAPPSHSSLPTSRNDIATSPKE